MKPGMVSIIVPAINEAENLPLLAPRIAAALGDRPYEILIVDDNSRDGTPQVCENLSAYYPLKLLVRTHPKNGLSGAVLHGMAIACGDVFVVMDADLQHPPDRIPALLQALEDGADFVIGSRYVPGGGTEEHWGWFRHINSLVATLLARPFAGRTHDPMSGFFALRAETYRSAKRLTPLGYKIALELMCKCRVSDVREIPIRFGLRTKGQSKLSIRQQFRYLEHLSRLYDFTFPRLSPVVKFLVATLLGWLPSLAVFLFLAMGMSPNRAAVLAYPTNILMTALFHLRYVRTQREFLVRPRPWLDFAIISAVEWMICAASSLWLADRAASVSALEVFVVSYGAALVSRYVLRKEFMQDIRGLRRELRADES